MNNRTKYQGVFNIIRFNWPFYIIGLTGSLLLVLVPLPFMRFFSLLIIGQMFISLLVSWYVYDLSGIYELNWLKEMDGKVLNINAGFDEISVTIRNRFEKINLKVLDFYDDKLMTESSIKRARKAYPLEAGTELIKPTNLCVSIGYDKVILFFSAHEIRKKIDRDKFFEELNRITNTNGEIYIIEHLRDWKNFLAYTVGYFHFYSKKTWLSTFKYGGFELIEEDKITPFVTLFKLKKNGSTS
ncbi:MAG: methyltransferase [Flavobacteriales bacterium]|nr:methyltransferase [Flavobacteriales bacterium]|tara:strand:+ start:21825 stop:22550 length:726 start_codon:yes stop_codon:yes gene_type:complete